MLSLRSLWSVVLFIYAFDTSNTLEFAPTHTWATLQSSALAWNNLPTITAGTFHDDLKARAASQQNTICGWIDGNGASAVSCLSGDYCATESTFVGCCDPTSCAGIHTTCYDLLGSICDAACQNNIGNLFCSSTLPYCATYNYESGSVGYGCAVAQGYTVSVLLSTTTSDGGPLTTPALTNTPTATSSAFAAPTTSTTVASSSSKKGLGGGPIAGIVIGSVAVVALIAFLIVLLFRTRRKHREDIQPLQQRNSFPLRDRDNYRGRWYWGTAAGYYTPGKENSMPDSPPPSETVGSPHAASFSHPPRHSHPPNYIGPTMPEMGPGVDHGWARP